MSKITVKAKAERGFYRAGLHFTRAGTDLDVADLTAEQLAAIKAEPNLVITGVSESDAEVAKREKAEAAEVAKREKAEAAGAVPNLIVAAVSESDDEAAKREAKDSAAAAKASASKKKAGGKAKGK